MNLRRGISIFLIWLGVAGGMRVLMTGISDAGQPRTVYTPDARFWIILVGAFVVIVVGVVGWFLLPQSLTGKIADRTLAFYRRLLGYAPVSLGKIVPRAVRRVQLSSTVAVTSSSGTVVKQYRMNYFDPDENSNKVWIGIAYSHGGFETRFGRVRDEANLHSSTKRFSDQSAALQELERKRREKLRKGYKDTVTIDNDTQAVLPAGKRSSLSKIAADEIEGSSDNATAELIKYLAEVNIHHITHSTNIKYNAKTGSFSTPLGILTPEAINEARDLIAELRRLDGLTRRQHKKRAGVVRQYFQLVPKDFGMKIPAAETLIATEEQFQEEVSILDALEAALSRDEPTPDRPRLFECRLTKVPHYTTEGRELYRRIRDLYFSTRNVQHHPVAAGLQMTRLYEVEIADMKRRYDATAARLGNIRDDLWHGTRASNLLSILKHGLVIPPANAAHCTGRMFGNGIYTSLQSTKALNYATGYWNRSGASAQRTFMFLCTVALGRVHKVHSYSGSYPVRNTNTTWVEPGRGGVLNHECIVYDASQINLRYLAEFGTK